jgi:hypothetical protein
VTEAYILEPMLAYTWLSGSRVACLVVSSPHLLLSMHRTGVAGGTITASTRRLPVHQPRRGISLIPLAFDVSLGFRSPKRNIEGYPRC